MPKNCFLVERAIPSQQAPSVASTSRQNLVSEQVQFFIFDETSKPFHNLTFTQRDLNGYSQPSRTTLFSVHGIQKTLLYQEPKKI